MLGSALAAAVAAAVTAVRRRRRIARADGSAPLTGMPALALEGGDDPTPADTLQPQPVPEPRPAPAGATTPSAATTPPAGPSRAELYRQARAAGIKGRSNMTKAQLEQALRQTGA